jgi:S-adenosylmethionine synthetase
MPSVATSPRTIVAAGLADRCDQLQLAYAIGHFGRKPEKDGGFSWERTDLVAELKRAFGAR